MHGLCSVDQADLRYAQMHASAPDPPGSYEFLVLVDLLMSENELCFPENIGDALNFYTELTVKFYLTLSLSLYCAHDCIVDFGFHQKDLTIFIVKKL